MKLYYSRGACSLSPHIALREAGLLFELESVNFADKRTQSGADYMQINSKGYVPALQLDDGSVLTEGPAILQYIADKKPESKLVAPAGNFERYRAQEWLTFIGTEIHKPFGPLWNSKSDPQAVKQATEKVISRLTWIEGQLGTKVYLMGDTFTAPDCYLFVMLRWSAAKKMDLASLPKLNAYFERIGQRQTVKDALAAESAKT